VFGLSTRGAVCWHSSAVLLVFHGRCVSSHSFALQCRAGCSSVGAVAAASCIAHDRVRAATCVCVLCRHTSYILVCGGGWAPILSPAVAVPFSSLCVVEPARCRSRLVRLVGLEICVCLLVFYYPQHSYLLRPLVWLLIVSVLAVSRAPDPLHRLRLLPTPSLCLHL
jgi:hypothetical protein